MGVILYCARLPYNDYPYRYRVTCDNDKIVFGNTDNTKYITANVYGQGNKTFYNSAGFYYSQGGYRRLALTLIATESFSWYCEYTTDGGQSWNAQQSGSSNLNENGLYAASWNAGYNNDYYYYNANDVMFEITENYIDLPIFNTESEYQNYIMTVAPPVYQWTSVSAISGRNGILDLPTLFHEPTDGEPVTDGTIYDFHKTPDVTNELHTLTGGMILNQETEIVVSGDDFRCTVTWNNTTAFVIKYYLPDSTTPFASISYNLSHANDEVYFAMLWEIYVDPEDPAQSHRWGRPSFIIRDSVSGLYSYNTETVDASLFDNFYSWIVASMTGGYSIFGPDNEEEGGDDYGTLQDDPIMNPAVPTIGAVATGFTRLYYITGANKSKLSDLMDWFNDEDLQFINQLFKGDPMQALVGVNLSPLALTAVGHPNIHFLGQDTGIASDGVIADQYQEIDCGSIEIKNWMKNSYLDFSPFTKIKVILPYIGAMDLNVDDLKYKTDNNGKRLPVTISLKYVVDALTGSCVAHLFVNNSLHYEASGNCFINIPLTQKDYSAEMQAIKQAIAGTADSLVKGAGLMAMGTGAGAGAIGAMVAGTLFGGAVNVAAQHPDIRYVGGNTGATTGYMGFDRPFLLIEQPVLARPAKDEHFIGMPSYITDTIGSFYNSSNSKPQFAKFNEIHLENINCLEQERNEILQYLTNGVMIDAGSDAPDVTPETTGNQVIILLHNESEKNVIGKTFTSGTGSRLKLESKLFFNQSVLNPVFVVPASEVYTYNYAYVPLLHRYYYITDIIALENNMLEIHMQVDALQSFKTEIKACKGICMRSEWRNNFLINDGAMTVKQPTEVKTLQFVKAGAKFSFTRGSAGFVIVCASGTTL